ncbi:MAG: hypothetical protein R2769_17225 [Saprospiraceae bacterium]
MDITGLIFEFIFLGMGIYLYMFSIGKVKAKNQEARERGENFRKNNRWLRIASLLLVAIISLNIFFHIKELLAN